jgi:hypothetical protein
MFLNESQSFFIDIQSAYTRLCSIFLKPNKNIQLHLGSHINCFHSSKLI